MRSFSSAIKGGTFVANVEKTLFEQSNGEPGVITEQWFTGASTMNENTTIRIYIDNESTPSIEFKLLLGHGVGFKEEQESQYLPWNTKRISLDAENGLYNTYQIPFLKSFRVTGTSPNGGQFFYIIRGVYNYPLIMGNLLLPANARLKLYKQVNVKLNPLQFLDLVDIENKSGALYMVTIAANSSNYEYLEACMRAVIDGSNQTTFLSSGTEDFFLSAYYFNKGVYHSENSGLTFKDNKGAMSAYKFFEDDPILFTKSFLLKWRCGEVTGEDAECPHDFVGSSSTSASYSTPRPFYSHHVSAPDVTIVTTYTWVYEWNTT